jgi:hypothetical protein
MHNTYRKVVETTQVFRLEVEGSIMGGDLNKVLGIARNDFFQQMGRTFENDDDYWLEPIDEGIAICFKVKARVKVTDQEAPVA